MEELKKRKETFQNTEKLLLHYQDLKEHLENEKEYIEMLDKQKSKSIIRYSKESFVAEDKENKIQERMESYERSKADMMKIENALKKVKRKKGYEVIEERYLKKKEDGTLYTYEEIAERLSQNKKYGESLCEKTARRYKNKIIEDMSIILFGSDAL